MRGEGDYDCLAFNWGFQSICPPPTASELRVQGEDSREHLAWVFHHHLWATGNAMILISLESSLSRVWSASWPLPVPWKCWAKIQLLMLRSMGWVAFFTSAHSTTAQEWTDWHREGKTFGLNPLFIYHNLRDDNLEAITVSSLSQDLG